ADALGSVCPRRASRTPEIARRFATTQLKIRLMIRVLHNVLTKSSPIRCVRAVKYFSWRKDPDSDGTEPMRYLALACDYDGTLATHGRVGKETLAALERLRASGRTVILVTGRELDDLLSVFSHPHLFEWIVAENGAVLFQPSTCEEKVLGERPP